MPIFKRIAAVSLLLTFMGIPTPGAFAQDASAQLLPIGTAAPDFTAQSWNGGTVHLSDYRGKIVVLDFWATWCGPCNQAMPHLQKIHENFHDDNVVVLGLCIDDKPANANAWVSAHKQDTFTFLMDPAGEQADSLGPANDIPAHYGVKAIPTTYIINPNGVITARGVSMEENQIALALGRTGAHSLQDKLAAQQMSDDIKAADAANAADESAKAKQTHAHTIPHGSKKAAARKASAKKKR